MRIKGVLFDKDGVLVDFQGTWGPACARVIHALAEGDAVRGAALADAISFDLEKELFRPDSVFIAGSGADTLEAWSGILGLRDDPGLVFRVIEMMTEAGLRTVRATPSLVETLAQLRLHGLRVGIATNDQQASATAQMERLGQRAQFDLILGADSGHGAKPGPGMIHAFADHIDAEPDRVAMIGDSMHDIRAARAAGAVAVAIGTGPAALESLRPHADHAIETLADLPRLLGLADQSV